MTDNYTSEYPAYACTFITERLRRERHELIGELSVQCSMPGVKSVNGMLTTGDFNFSSVRARQDRAKLIIQRANTNGQVDWFALLEDFCQKVFAAEKEGDPAVDLRSLSRPARDDELRIHGLCFPRRHPTILFGDGGSAKSYTALYVAGILAQEGLNTAYFDWELSGEDHRDRLERLFPIMPLIQYVRCERPLTAEMDRLRRVVRDHKIVYAVFDSVAFACDGRPEDAEIAGRYFRAIREINCGSLHVAHVSKSEDNDRKPFGSSFWHNGARSTWFVQASEPEPDHGFRLGFFNRKSNLGPLHQPAAFQISFGPERTNLRPSDIAEDPDMVLKMSIRQRMLLLLKHGSWELEDLATELNQDKESIRRTANRYRNTFIVLTGGRVGLKERSS